MKTAPWFAHNGVQEADARFIVRACNHHDELVGALESIAGAVADAVDHKIHTGRLPPIGGLLSQIEDTARAILAKLENDNA